MFFYIHIQVAPSSIFFFDVSRKTLSLCCRHRKDELERRMSALQESRRELMVQLEGLMRLLKVRQSPAPGGFMSYVGRKKASESVLISSDSAYVLNVDLLFSSGILQVLSVLICLTQFAL